MEMAFRAVTTRDTASLIEFKLRLRSKPFKGVLALAATTEYAHLCRVSHRVHLQELKLLGHPWTEQ